MRQLYLLFILVLAACQPSQKIEIVDSETIIEEFPKTWEGKWEGRLKIFNAKGLAQEIYMGLEILPIDTSENHTWTIIYGEGDDQQIRAYELITKDAAIGHYLIDEKNSIILDDYLLGNTLYSRFDVMGSLLTAVYRKEGDKIIFDIIAGSAEPISTTGGEDDIPEVNSFKITNAQRAVLTRKKE